MKAIRIIISICINLTLLCGCTNSSGDITRLTENNQSESSIVNVNYFMKPPKTAVIEGVELLWPNMVDKDNPSQDAINEYNIVRALLENEPEKIKDNTANLILSQVRYDKSTGKIVVLFALINTSNNDAQNISFDMTLSPKTHPDEPFLETHVTISDEDFGILYSNSGYPVKIIYPVKSTNYTINEEYQLDDIVVSITNFVAEPTE